MNTKCTAAGPVFLQNSGVDFTDCEVNICYSSTAAHQSLLQTCLTEADEAFVIKVMCFDFFYTATFGQNLSNSSQNSKKHPLSQKKKKAISILVKISVASSQKSDRYKLHNKTGRCCKADRNPENHHYFTSNFSICLDLGLAFRLNQLV